MKNELIQIQKPTNDIRYLRPFAMDLSCVIKVLTSDMGEVTINANVNRSVEACVYGTAVVPTTFAFRWIRGMDQRITFDMSVFSAWRRRRLVLFLFSIFIYVIPLILQWVIKEPQWLSWLMSAWAMIGMVFMWRHEKVFYKLYKFRNYVKKHIRNRSSDHSTSLSL